MTYYIGNQNCRQEAERRHCSHAVVYIHNRDCLEVMSFHRSYEAACRKLREMSNSFWGIANIEDGELVYSLHK